MTDKQMLEILEEILSEDSPDQLRLELFSYDCNFFEDKCGQLLLFG